MGGAIETNKVRFKDIETRRPDTNIDRVMQRVALGGPSAPAVVPMPAMVHGLPDMIPRNNIAFNQYIHFFGKHNEEELFHNVMSLLTGKGSTDHPRVQALMQHSLGGHPDLLSLYNRH